MVFLLISQRAKANPNYSLKDLPGHGRLDVVIRCILAATRKLETNDGEKIFCYLKGSDPHGWLEIDHQFVSHRDDEISLAAKIQERWQEIFTEGPLNQLVERIDPPFYLLSEEGGETQNFSGCIVLGAQRDLTDEDVETIPIEQEISLGDRSLLASHAIIYSRQLNL